MVVRTLVLLVTLAMLAAPVAAAEGEDQPEASESAGHDPETSEASGASPSQPSSEPQPSSDPGILCSHEGPIEWAVIPVWAGLDDGSNDPYFFAGFEQAGPKLLDGYNGQSTAWNIDCTIHNASDFVVDNVEPVVCEVWECNT